MSTRPDNPINSFGVYYPVKIKANNLKPKVFVSAKSSARLYKRSGRKPNVFQNSIKGKNLSIVPSFSSNFGK